MLTYINELKENPDLLESKNRLKRFFLKADEYVENREEVTYLMRAYDMGIVSWLRSGKGANAFEKAILLSKLEEQGIPGQSAEKVYSAWAEIVSNLYEDTDIGAEPELQAVLDEGEPEPLAEESVGVMNSVSYVNPRAPETEGIYIPCGFGQTDHGFFIEGIPRQERCLHRYADLYALVYNLLVRNTNMGDDSFREVFAQEPMSATADSKSIYRLAVILLEMIHHNMSSNGTLHISVEDGRLLGKAISVIDHYAEVFSALLRLPAVRLSVINDRKGTPISLGEKQAGGIGIVNNTGEHSAARDIWYGHKLFYRLGKAERPAAERLLRIISPYERFREGQYEALCNMLKSEGHCVCIMPTGSGKSLLYYMASFLQPLPIFVVSPTDILIEDQIRNLQNIHHVDNVAHLELTPENSFARFSICNSLNYLTPSTLQNRNLLVKFRYINNGTQLVDRREKRIADGPLAAYIILDEIHCLSNWGHDFRPEYLVLSRYLNRLLDRVTFWGFTATANYTVVEDVQKQLGIPQENFFSPVSFEKYNVTYHFYEAPTTEKMEERLKEITDTLIRRGERTMVFTKNDDMSRRAAECIGFEADVFTHENPYAYQHFADEKCLVLVASEELGIGINFPNIRNVIHFGLPLSKNEYVQEVGRAGRNNESVKSYVLFLKNSEENIPPRLLRRDASMNDVPEFLKNTQNDYADVYKKLTGGCPTKEILFNGLCELMKQLDYQTSATFVRSVEHAGAASLHKQLFMLHTLGYVRDWYTYEYNARKQATDIFIDICSTDTLTYRQDPNKMFIRMQESLVNYFDSLGDNREASARANRARSEEELLRVYVNWYYEKYLYRHSEEFIDLYEFVAGNMRSADDHITDQIKDYFVLPFIKLQTDEAYYRSLSVQEILDKALVGVGRETISNLERINSNRYSTNIDLLLYCGHYRMNRIFEPDRLKRVLARVSEEDRKRILKGLRNLYGTGTAEVKLEFLKFLHANPALMDVSAERFLTEAYRTCEKDLIYYGIMAQHVNRVFDI